MELKVVLQNIRSCYNVGAILRTAEGFGAQQVVLSGYTPRVDDGRVLPHLREKLNREIHKTALGAERLVDIYASDDIFKDLRDWRKQGWKVVGLENNIQDGRLLRLGEDDLEVLGEKVVLVLGEEVEGIDESLYGAMDYFLEIPMKGKKESFNVSVAAGVAMYHLAFLLGKKGQ